MEKVSIVLPCYNVEKYLKKCINSLVVQTYTNIEMIIVDDGSSDDTLNVAKTCANIDNRIIVFSQPNKGVSTARNVAIEKSSGKYIVFVDPDDYVSNDFIEKLYNRMLETESDLSVCGHIKVYDDGKEVPSQTSHEKIENKIMFKQYFIANSTFTTLMCDKMFKTNIIKENKIFFPKDVTSGQDQVFILDYLIYCKSVATINGNYYYYYQRVGSKSKRYEYYIFQKTLSKLEYIKKILVKNNIFSKYKEYYKIRLYMNFFSQGFLLYQYVESASFKKVFRQMKKDTNIYIGNTFIGRFFDIVFFAKLNFKERIACFVVYFMPIFFVKKLYKNYLKKKQGE